MNIKAIETKYNGYRFRSRLEARWAVFWDCLGVEYYYEEQGYYLDGTYYLPDFYIPATGIYIEIKGVPLNTSEHDKAVRLCYGKQRSVHVFVGDPFGCCLRYHLVFIPWGTTSKRWSSPRTLTGLEAWDLRKIERTLDMIEKNGMVFGHEYKTFYWKTVGDAAYDICRDGECPETIKDYEVMSFVRNAAIQARQARFEHGETYRANKITPIYYPDTILC